MLLYMLRNGVDGVPGLMTMIVTLLALRAAAAALTWAGVSGNGPPVTMMIAMRWVPALALWCGSQATVSFTVLSMLAIRL